ncbi:MAG TPA: DUF3089 domain-containing protein, partial [Steroidobacteraceae bacterium]|nr:DUF3089 domain-containing protein [Steroidobacteraceae bacterium]
IVGYELPLEMEQAGVPVCRSATQTRCFVDWNTVKAGHSDKSREDSRLVWLAGRYQPAAGRPMTCVNPLSWQPGGSAAAALNLGALPGVRPGQELRAPVAHLTGARCEDGVLHIDIPLTERRGFADLLTLFGSYHIYDYNLFYVNIRSNALERINAWHARAGGAEP